MARTVENRGIVYWTNRENMILSDNIDKPLIELRELLPSRSNAAIYQRRLKLKRNPSAYWVRKKSNTKEKITQNEYSVTQQRTANSISFEIHGISITINFQK